MNDTLPLLALLWFATRTARASTAAPQWPTPHSPPPMPAFQSRKTAPSADATKTSTPLAELHHNPPQPPAASAIDTAKQKAQTVVRKRATQLLQQQARAHNPFAQPTTSTALVSNLQAILQNHGVKIPRDGLYGPKTASAWSALAKRKGLVPSISREGPKAAKVVTQTFERLQTPPIP